MERILKPEVFLPLVVALVLAFGLFSCKKEEPSGPQYSLSRTFLNTTRSDYPMGTRWVYRDSATGERFSLTLSQIDSLVLQAGPGFAGYTYYKFGLRLLADSSLIPLPGDSIVRDTFTIDSLNIDSITFDTIRFDTIIQREWRVLPFASVLAGSALGTREQALFFHTDSISEGESRQGITYAGRRRVNLRDREIADALSFRSEGLTDDSLSATELQWAPGEGLIRFRTRSGRVFLRDSLNRP